MRVPAAGPSALRLMLPGVPKQPDETFRFALLRSEVYP